MLRNTSCMTYSKIGNSACIMEIVNLICHGIWLLFRLIMGIHVVRPIDTYRCTICKTGASSWCKVVKENQGLRSSSIITLENI